MLEDFLADPAAIQRWRAGVFGLHVDSFVANMSKLGYTKGAVQGRLRVLADLEHWLKRKRLKLVDLQEEIVKRFLETRRRAGGLKKGDARTMRHFLEHLHDRGVVPLAELPIDRSPLAMLQKQHETYLRKERGLSPITIDRYWRFVRHFLAERFGDGPVCPRKLTPDDISGFLLRHARAGSPGVAKLMVTALRSFCRFLFRQGKIDHNLAGAVPTVPTWRHAELPRYLEGHEVERVIQSCDRSISLGRRNYAILLLLARLGLRASEVIALELDDIDWRAGVLTVRGKGRYHDRLPLPQDVGEAIAAYLRQDRPRCTTRRVFIRNKAPHLSLGNPSSISTIVCRALRKVGLQPNLKGAHLLRHSLATGMLRRGASMAEIGQVLRHRTPNTTEIYAKVDVKGLRSLALPWPMKGGAS